jgi:integrase
VGGRPPAHAGLHHQGVPEGSGRGPNGARDDAADGLPGPPPTLPELVVHELRHSHLTILLRSGVPVHVVAKRAGHKDPSVTLNVYADVIPDDDTSAVDVFSKAVLGA